MPKKKEGTHGLPKELVVKIENADTPNQWFNAGTDPAVLAEVGEGIIVGVYKLVRTEVITAPISRHPTWMGMNTKGGRAA
jgi:hypothetical protein